MLSLCMIVKNEEQFLEQCLQSIKDYVDDMVVVDTGSMDRTKQIAQECGARVFDFVWCNDFSAARNFAASHAIYDWVFAWDADQVIVEFDKQGIKNAMKSDDLIGMTTLYNVMENEGYTVKYTNLYNRKRCCYYGKIHEQIRLKDDPDGEKNVVEIPVFANHYGYHSEVMKAKNKLAIYENMLREEIKENPNNPYLYYQLGKTYYLKNAPSEKKENMISAITWFEKALSLRLSPYLVYAYDTIECYVYALINSGQPEKAMKIIQKYAKYYSKMSDFRFLSAHVYQENAMFVEAVESYESCIGAQDGIADGVNSYLSYYNIAVILECIGMIQDAKDYYSKCGDYEPALERLKMLR